MHFNEASFMSSGSTRRSDLDQTDFYNRKHILHRKRIFPEDMDVSDQIGRACQHYDFLCACMHFLLMLMPNRKTSGVPNKILGIWISDQQL